jgi:hypothetical protein
MLRTGRKGDGPIISWSVAGSFDSSRRGMKTRLDLIEHLLFVGELPGLELGPDHLAVDIQLKAAATAGDEFEVGNLLLESVKNLRRQTDGFRFVVSNRTVFEREVHNFVLLIFVYRTVVDRSAIFYAGLGRTVGDRARLDRSMTSVSIKQSCTFRLGAL